MATGLTGDPVHTGSWGLPDFGVTEWIGNLIGQPRTAQGGSNLDLSPDMSQINTTSVPWEQLGLSSNALSGGQVLPASTQNTGGGNTGGGQKTTTTGGGGGGGGSVNKGNLQQYFPGYAGWNPDAAWADYQATGGAGKGGGGGGGGGEPDWSQLISEQYAPALGALGQIETSLKAGQAEGLGGVEQTYTSGQETIGREKGELEASLTEQGRRLAETVRSAYADALRAYNNLIQQGMARFGAGSSAGPAVQELVNQEFLRSRGKLGQQAVQGEQQMVQEWTKLGNYITQKKSDLDTWKRGAVQQINDNFRNAMNEIAMRRGDIEANKTRDKVAALQNAVNMARQVESEDRQVRMNLAQFAVETMQNLSQRAFTPQEIASVVGQVMQAEIPGLTNRASAAASTTTNPYSYYNPYTSRKTEEENTGAVG